MSPPAMVTTVTQPANSPSSSSSVSRTTTASGGAGGSASSATTVDSLFEPSVEMMVNDFDDERTLEEEEALAATEAEDTSAELSNLQRERDMPIEELLALYNCRGGGIRGDGSGGGGGGGSGAGDDKEDAAEEATEGSVGSPEPRPISSTSSHNSSNAGMESEDGPDSSVLDKEEEESELRKLYPETFPLGDQRHLRILSRPQSEEEDDGDYSPDEDDVKKTIMVGSEYQAVIPEGLCKYGDALPYENEDKLVWDPSILHEQQVEHYEQKCNVLTATASVPRSPSNIDTAVAIQSTSPSSSSGEAASTNAAGATSGTKISSPSSPLVAVTASSTAALIASIPIGAHLRDDEQTLYLLLQCGHNVDEALRRRRINAVSAPANEMSQWSEEECRNFESGIRIYGKDFHTIQQLKVRTRSVGELVQFYYLWKKTERHDVFANKARLEKKKYNLHPGLTDYMDRFLEEHECNGSGSSAGGGGSGLAQSGQTNSIGIRDRSMSPSVSNSLLYTNYRRHRNGTASGDHNVTGTVDPVGGSELVAGGTELLYTKSQRFKEQNDDGDGGGSGSGGGTAKL